VKKFFSSLTKYRVYQDWK